MIRVGQIFKLIVCSTLVLSLTACATIKGNTDDEVKKETSKKEVVELNIWTYAGEMNEAVKAFEDENPNIKINVKNFEYEEYEEAYKKSLMEVEGEADIFIIDSSEYGSFYSIKGLENLLKPEYNAKDYKEDFDKDLWEVGMSADRKELLGIPIASAPIVTFYREDIMRKYGFPSDPYELAEYMKDKDNWLKIAKTLAKDNIYIMQWIAEITRIRTAELPYYNEKFEYQRDNKVFEEGIDLAREVKINKLSPLTDIWTEEGEGLIKNNQLAMLYLGSWGAGTIESIAPEQKGLWRVTNLPFGVNGWNNASIMSIAENSKHKEEAWKFMEFYLFKYEDKARKGNVSGYLPFRMKDYNTSKTNEFLGGQQEQKMYEEIMSNLKEYPVTPLDAEAFKMWDNLLNEGLDDGLTTERIMENIRDKEAELFDKKKKLLLESMD